MKKCNISSNPNYFPVLDYRDVQLFLKRLRKKINNEKIRYFYAGEMGPVHFRPHFHLLLWFEEEETQQNIIENIRASWPFGRIDVSLSRGKSLSYVASYINSAMYLPELFRLRKSAPKSYHSFYLGDKVFTCQAKITTESEFARFASHRIVFNGINSEFVLWRSLKTRLAPQCKGYNRKSESERVLSCQLYAKIRSWTREDRPKYQAKFIRDYVELFDFYSPDDGFNEVLQYFRSGLNYYSLGKDDRIHYIKPYLADYDKFEDSVYKELLFSRKFIEEFCNGDYSYGCVRNKLSLIDNFLKYIDYENLRKQLDVVSKTSKMSDALPLKFFYHNLFEVDELKELPEYNRFIQSRRSMYRNYMKHKELNDKNKIFCYG